MSALLRKRTWFSMIVMSVFCQKWTFLVKQLVSGIWEMDRRLGTAYSFCALCLKS
jgi:hypothetical protein